jgi:hypothetical protein
MNNLKIGDFLFRVEGDETAIAVVKSFRKGEIIMTVVESNPIHTYTKTWTLDEVQAEGWIPLKS